MNPDTHPAAQPHTEWEQFGFDTRQVHAGERPDLNAGMRVPPIAVSAGYVFHDFADSVSRFTGESAEPIYSRQGNPTNTVAEARLASLEGGTVAVAVSSGQAAITAALFTLAESGDQIVSTASIYGGTRILFGRSFRRFGIDVDYVWNTNDDDEWDRVITSRTKAIFTESIPNPLNDVTDLKRISEIAARYGIPVVVDNTVATPALIRPFEHGAHIVVHSTTKFLSGHGSALGGAIIDGGSFDWAASPRHYPLITDSARPGAPTQLERRGNAAYGHAAREAVVNDIGPALSPFNGFLLHQGMETLSLRMERHANSAHHIATWLAQQPEVAYVDYAGLPEHPLYHLAQRDYQGRSGSVFGVTLHGGQAGAQSFIDGLQIFARMTGIGDTRSMAIHPATSTHATFDAALNERLGITPGLVRLSVGIESVDDLIHDLRNALDRVSHTI